MLDLESSGAPRPGVLCWRAVAVAALSAAAAALVAAVTVIPGPASGGSPTHAWLTDCPVQPANAACGGWSGYVAQNVNTYEVAATFQVPDITCTQNGGYESAWVGVDGAQSTGSTTQAIAQAGITMECLTIGAQPQYHAFDAAGAGGGPNLPQPVQPGDTINVEVGWFFTWFAWIQDVNQNWEQLIPLNGGPVNTELTAVAGEQEFGGVTSSGTINVSNAQINFSPLGGYQPQLNVQDVSSFSPLRGGICGQTVPGSLVPTDLDGTGQNFQFLWEQPPPTACQGRSEVVVQ